MKFIHETLTSTDWMAASQPQSVKLPDHERKVLFTLTVIKRLPTLSVARSLCNIIGIVCSELPLICIRTNKSVLNKEKEKTCSKHVPSSYECTLCIQVGFVWFPQKVNKQINSLCTHSIIHLKFESLFPKKINYFIKLLEWDPRTLYNLK